MSDDSNTKAKSFWTSLPGILTGLATLITAVGGVTAGVYWFPRECKGGVHLRDFVAYEVVEGQSYLICDGPKKITLDIISVTYSHKQLEFRMGTLGHTPKTLTIEFQTPTTLFDGPGGYEGEVLDVADWAVGKDTARVSIRKK